MHRVDWLLLLLAVRDATEPLDPVRLQKGMFLLARESNLPNAECYEFVAYDYGPFSAEIHHDLNMLYECGRVERLPVAGYSWFRYRPTVRGLHDAEHMLLEMDTVKRGCAQALQRLKQGVLRRSFRELLEYVYERYPEYAENSVFTR